ncbi:hypothetical protein AVEN_124262-1 [Araneus ventricosus]|uniref:Uncharacterized protein n=1 Tax=Araneus ventricosus TaxID=182803 RepID=A0A4Y2QG99_ARAVE|nr:hypothetical protein AVEN_124262-1 [Araneus ventricosus]
MLVLWLGREFYRSKYSMIGSNQAWTTDLGDELGDHFGDLAANSATLATKCGTTKMLEFSRYFYEEQRSRFIQMIHVTSRPVGKTMLGSQNIVC